MASHWRCDDDDENVEIANQIANWVRKDKSTRWHVSAASHGNWAVARWVVMEGLFRSNFSLSKRAKWIEQKGRATGGRKIPSRGRGVENQKQGPLGLGEQEIYCWCSGKRAPKIRRYTAWKHDTQEQIRDVASAAITRWKNKVSLGFFFQLRGGAGFPTVNP